MASHLKELVKRVLPQKAVSFLSDCRDIGPAGRWTYLKLRISRAVRRRGKEWRNTAAGIRSVLFVCSGNVIRSPMAAALLRQSLPYQNRAKISATSAGLHALPGGSADPRALIVAREFGVSLDNHVTQPLTTDLIGRAELILVMDYRTVAELLARYPEAKHRVFLAGDFAEEGPAKQIELPDPYSGDRADIRRCYQTLQTWTHHLASLLAGPTHGEIDSLR
jgi:protein-tyrosine phosphatase